MRAAVALIPPRLAPAAGAAASNGCAPHMRALHLLVLLWLALQLFYTTQFTPFQFKCLVNVTPDRLALGAVALLFGWRLLADRESLRPPGATEALMLALSLAALASLIGSGAGADTSHGPNAWLSTLFCFFFVPYIAYFLASNMSWDEAATLRLCRLLCLMGLYLGLTAACEMLRPGLVYPRYIMDPRLGTNFGRARGPMLNSGFLGLALNYCFFATLLAAAFSRSALRRLLCLAAGPVILAGIYFTYTRGPWLGLGAGLAVLLAGRTRLRRWAAACCLAAVLAACGLAAGLPGARPSLAAKRLQVHKTIYDRVNIMAAALRMVSDRPLQGVGYGRFGSACRDYWNRVGDVPLRGLGEGNHNVPLGIMAELGVPIALLYLALLGRLWAQGRGLYRRLGSEAEFPRAFVLFFLACFAAYLVQMQVLELRWNMFQNVVPFTLAGVVSALGWGRQRAALRP